MLGRLNRQATIGTAYHCKETLLWRQATAWQAKMSAWIWPMAPCTFAKLLLRTTGAKNVAAWAAKPGSDDRELR